jgi:peptide chain release factor 3
VLGIQCAPVTWPIGMGKRLPGVVSPAHRQRGAPVRAGRTHRPGFDHLPGLDNPGVDERFPPDVAEVRDELELVQGASASLRPRDLPGRQADAGVLRLGHQQLRRAGDLLDFFVDWAPPPQARDATASAWCSRRSAFTGFVFKIQANMDPKHRDRIAFMRVCSGRYSAGMKVVHVRAWARKDEARQCADLHGQRARDRRRRLAGDIIGIHNHGTAADRRHLHRRREASASPASRTSRPNCSAARACAIRSSSSSCRRACRSWARKARPSSSAR